jgi:hypothetical protein
MNEPQSHRFKRRGKEKPLRNPGNQEKNRPNSSSFLVSWVP